MAIAFDASSSFQTTAASSLSWSHTCTGSDRYLFVGLGGESFGPTISSATYNSVSMTELWDATFATFYHHGALGLIAPATGTNTISVTYTGTFDRIMGTAVSYTGVHQTTPTGTAATATGTGTTATVNVTSASGELVVDNVRHIAFDVLTVGAGQTQRLLVGTNWAAGVSDEAGAGTVTMSWSSGSSSSWAIGGIPLKPSSGAANLPWAQSLL